MGCTTYALYQSWGQIAESRLIAVSVLVSKHKGEGGSESLATFYHLWKLAGRHSELPCLRWREYCWSMSVTNRKNNSCIVVCLLGILGVLDPECFPC